MLKQSAYFNYLNKTSIYNAKYKTKHKAESLLRNKKAKRCVIDCYNTPFLLSTNGLSLLRHQVRPDGLQ